MALCSLVKVSTVLLCLILSYTSAQTDSCILLKDYLSPSYSYSVFKTDDDVACWEACVADPNCVIWSRDVLTGKCALKADSDVLISVVGVHSGVKYRGAATPVLENNNVGASVLVAKVEEPEPEPEPEPQPQSHTITAFASASSDGGTSKAVVTTDGENVMTDTEVTGDGVATTEVTTPTISLKTITVAEDGETAKLAVSYFKNATYVGTVPVGSKSIQIVTDAVKEPPCLSCAEYTCIYQAAAVYKGKTRCKKV